MECVDEFSRSFLWKTKVSKKLLIATNDCLVYKSKTIATFTQRRVFETIFQLARPALLARSTKVNHVKARISSYSSETLGGSLSFKVSVVAT